MAHRKTPCRTLAAAVAPAAAVLLAALVLAAGCAPVKPPAEPAGSAAPAKPAAASPADPDALVAIEPVAVHADPKAKPPETPKVGQLEKKPSVTQYGITFTFASAVTCGRFVTGDWFVVGPVTISAISPAPSNGFNGAEVRVC